MRVRPAAIGDTKALAAALARAFEDDPLFGWFFPRAETRLAKMVAMNEATFPRLLPVDFIEVHTTDDCAGVSIWAGPEKWEPPTPAFLPVVPRLVRIMGIGGLMRLGRGMGALKKAHPKEPHWYLAGLGTDPPKQGTGVGTALVRRKLEECDAQKLPAYLETQKQRNVPYYEKFGFRVTGELDMPGGGPHLWLMWREPL